LASHAFPLGATSEQKISLFGAKRSFCAPKRIAFTAFEVVVICK
jgi:hypothetical protein